MRSLLLAFATVSGQQFSTTTSFGAPAPAAAATAPAASASTTTSLQDRQFLFANPAADALALEALKPNATNPFATLLIAGAIDGKGGLFGGNGGYQQQRYPSYSSYPTYYPPAPSYPTYSYPSASYPSYSYPATSFDTSYSYSTPTYSAPSYSYSTPSYSTPSYSYPSYSSYQPSYSSYQPSYPSFQPSYYPTQSYSSWGASSSPYPDPLNDPLKQAIILNGIQKGTINSVTAVGLDRNPDMSALGAQVFTSLGNTPLTTALAVSGGFGGNNYYSQYGGSVFGGNPVGNYLFYNQVLGGTSPVGR